MADFDDWDVDGGMAGSDGAGQTSGTPEVNGGLLDPNTFPSPWPPLTDSPSIDRPAPEITGPLDTDVHGQVLQDILDAQAKLRPIPDDLSIDRPAPVVNGPLTTDPHADAFQNFLNAQAGLPPVKPHPETWSINGQPYLAIAARTFDPARSNGVTSMPTPADSAAAFGGMAQVAVPLGREERGGYIAHNPSKVVVTYGEPGGSDTADTLRLNAPIGSPFVHGHIDNRRPDPSDRLTTPEPPPGMIDRPDANGGYGDSQSLSQHPVPTATVSNGRVGWHVLDNGQLKFLYPPGSMDSLQIGRMRQNLDDEQKKFLRPK